MDAGTEARLREALSENAYKTPGKNKAVLPWWPTDTRWRNIISAYLAEPAQQHDPLRDWLVGCKKTDAITDPDAWLADRFSDGLDADQIVTQRAYWRVLLAGIVMAIDAPGRQWDQLPVATGATGIGKTTVVDFLTPEGSTTILPRALVTGANNARDAMLEALSALVVVDDELAVLGGPRRVSTEEAKAFLSRRKFKLTPKWVARPQDYPRRFLTVGSANLGQGIRLPYDPAMMRRVLPARLHRRNVTVPVSSLIPPTDRDRLIGGAIAALNAERQGWLLTAEGLDLTQEERYGFATEYAMFLSDQHRGSWETDTKVTT